MDGTSLFWIVWLSFLVMVTIPSAANETITPTRFLKDGEKIVSTDESFALGFFSPGSSKNRYLGIWYNKVPVQTVVWVANRYTPLVDSSGVLQITSQGSLVLVNQNGSMIWSSNSSSTKDTRYPVAQLLNSGNLVVRNEGDTDNQTYLWQSFDYPSDTILPEMKLGWNKVIGLGRYTSPWRTPEDPAPGNFTFGIDIDGYPQMIVRENSIKRFRGGPWNGLRFSGTPQLNPNPIYTFGFVLNDNEVYYHYELINSSRLSRMVINQNGDLQRFTWIKRIQRWELYLTVQTDNCDRYALCGAYGSCDINKSPACSCLKGFEPTIPKEWETVDWSSGCVRKTPLNCSNDGFLHYSDVKWPETQTSWYNDSMNIKDCKIWCMKNCSCSAYTTLDIRKQSGCLLWFGDLIDIRKYDENGQDIYIRMAASELVEDTKIKSSSFINIRIKIILSSVLSIVVLFLGLSVVLYVWKKKQQKHAKETSLLEDTSNNNGRDQNNELELPSFDFDTLACATNNFSIVNILGQGGYGPVFKGILSDGREIAVKRLSKDSKQGLGEFKNEVMHIAKLQHRNLVRLLGCCIQYEEKMLIYEFMPNKSLDFFIFDEKRCILLDWSKRYNIINGIARGLLYLHQDSRLRIVHRDLKAGNVLLDDGMNPKISDFGLARSFGGNETGGNTNRVVGTYGYMSPEYAIDGLYSVKSDVYSFGVIVIETVSGKRNRGFRHPEHHLNLLGHTWRLHMEGRSIEMIEPAMRSNSCNLSEMLRCVHVGLLCVQRNLEDRPSMSSVVVMLSGEGALVEPKQPGFFTERDIQFGENFSSSNQSSYSANGLSITQQIAR